MIFYTIYKLLVIGCAIIAVLGLYCEDTSLVISSILFAILFQLAAMEERT